MDLYAPQRVDLGGGGSPSRNGMIQYRKWPEQQKHVKCIDSTSMCTLVTVLYQVPVSMYV